MDKIQVKDLTTEYIIEKLQDAHPFFKLGKPIMDKYTVGSDGFGNKAPSYVRYDDTNDNANRSKDALLNYLRQPNRNDLFDVIIKYEKNLFDDTIAAFWWKTSDLHTKYQYKQPYTIGEELRRVHRLAADNEVRKLLDPHLTTARIRILFIESPSENCVRLQAIISAPAIDEFASTKIDAYFSNLDEAIDILREQYTKTKDNQILDAANYIEDNKQSLYDSFFKILKNIDYDSLRRTKIDVCDVELDPEVANLNVSVSKISNLTQEEYEDPIMSEFVLIRLQQVQRSLENLLNHKLVSKYTPYADRVGVEVTPDLIFSYASYSYFAQASELKYDYTSQKLLTYLNARLRASKAKTREREILKTFKEQMSPIVERIKEIYTDVRPYVQPRSRYCISEELQSEIMKDFDTGRHDHTQAVIDKLANAISETRALCEAYNDEYRRMLDAIAEDL